MANKEVVKAKNLSASVANKIIWANASFEIKSGEFFGVLGPNGAGKTTLFKLLLGLLPPAGGTIQVFGSKPHRGNPRIGYVPQRRLIDSELSVASIEFVRLGIKSKQWGYAWRSEEKALARDALMLVDALHLADKSIGKLSGGEAQRIYLAQAIVGKPNLLLLDEPLSNLDIRREVDLVALINKIVREQGISAVLIAHDINPLIHVLDKILYIANGQVVSGSPKEVVTSENLSKLYGAPVEVLRDSKGRVAVLGIEEAAHHE